jgi:hypothetical protein
VLQIQQTAPGRWLVVSVPGRLVVVECTTPSSELAASLWSAVADADNVQPVLDHLTRHGLLATPAFALVEWDDEAQRAPARFIVRGSARVIVDAATGERQVSASGVSTWLEQVIDDVSAFRIDLGTAPTADDILLPLSAGAAWVTGVRSSVGVPAPVRIEPPAVGTPVGDTPVIEEPAEQGADPVEAEPIDTTAIAEATVVESFDSGPVPVVDAETEYDHLFGATMMRSVEDAAVRENEGDDDAPPVVGVPSAPIVAPVAPSDAPATSPDAAQPAAAVQELGDHDGLTVFSGDIHKLRGERNSAPGDEEAPAIAPPAPAAGFVLQVTGGATEPLIDTVLVGRAPSVSKVSGGQVPKLLTVGSADQDISRNHVQFAVEGDTVVVTDLHSRNGTLIVLPGKAPQKLRQGEPTSVIVGTLVDLGGGVTMTVGHA